MAPCCGPGFCGIPEMPGCREGQAGWLSVAHMAAAPIALNYVQLNGWAPPTSSESQECCHLATHSLISLAFSQDCWDKGRGRSQDSGGFWECVFASPDRRLSKRHRTLISLLTEGETEARKGQGLA